MRTGRGLPGVAGCAGELLFGLAILTVLRDAKPELVRTRDLEQRMAGRGKKVAGGLSVDLTALKQTGEAINPAWGLQDRAMTDTALAVPSSTARFGARGSRAARGIWLGGPPRAIHVPDPENLIGTGAPDIRLVRLLMACYAAKVDRRDGPGRHCLLRPGLQDNRLLLAGPGLPDPFRTRRRRPGAA